ncbi:MAG TPA: serine/threonine-protein kinase [Kofleriaceae bacterium]|nr:serine/threonine-protein kinase [Kofleriaceae bacterium]
MAFTLWLVVGLPVDVGFHDALGSGSLAFVVIVRIASSVYQLAVLALLYRRLEPRTANALISSVFPISGVAISLLALHMGGIASSYAMVVCVGILVLVTALPLPWRRGAVLAGSTVLIYPLTMFAAAAWDEGIAAQLRDPVARGYFVVFVLTLGAGAVCVTWAGHVLWSLRRSVFESRNLGRYRLIRRIGKGGMGEVWRAQDRALRREVALKILSPEHGRKPAAIARFEREIQATAEVAHPNVIRIHDWGVTDDGVWYYAMDLLRGCDLATLVKATGALPADLVVHLGLGVAAGLAECHRRGVIHRDIKPANLFVVAPQGEPERIELLDFGIARADTDSELTHPGAILGTPGFMAPEVMAGAPGGHAADLYSLGASLYYALVGKSPREATAPAPSQVARVPAELDDLIVQLLDREPSRRPRSADEVVAALAACGTAWTGSWRIDRTRDSQTPAGPDARPADADARHADADADVPSPPSERPTVAD